MTAPKKSALARALPLLKIGVAVVLVALILWFVQFRDHLILPVPGAAADRVVIGTIEKTGDPDRVVLRAPAGVVAIALEPGTEFVRRAEFPDGEVWTAPPAPAGGTGAGAADDESRARLLPGVLSILKNADVEKLGLALLLIFLGSIVAVYRWELLLIGVGLGIGFRRAFSLTFIGAFFNQVMPGLTGGDLVKAYYIAREHRDRKAEAIITVLLDRVLGITGLALVAALVIPTDFETYSAVAPAIFGLLFVLGAFACVFFSRRIRAALHFDALLERLPFQRVVKTIDRAVFLYRFRRRLVVVSLVLSMVVHTFIIAGIGVIGQALDLDLSFGTYFAVVPIALIAAALPVSPAGIGVGEGALMYFFGTVGVNRNAAVPLFILYRILQALIALIGGPCLAVQKDRASAAEVEEFAAEAEENGARSETPPPPGS